MLEPTLDKGKEKVRTVRGQNPDPVTWKSRANTPNYNSHTKLSLPHSISLLGRKGIEQLEQTHDKRYSNALSTSPKEPSLILQWCHIYITKEVYAARDTELGQSLLCSIIQIGDREPVMKGEAGFLCRGPGSHWATS